LRLAFASLDVEGIAGLAERVGGLPG